ncbi:hypothetical protein AAFF_G00230600 [Aldrovandia affinis]|uniref:Uncharacterized protein n=1 Tax=Aldrovandia affinis TaxID=143900 RepID=A0AAD7W4L8_9TELE|nr:hypothetical protein AAFF_G00230600 [Aldrovandia affinis]
MDLMTPQEQIRSLVEKIVRLIGERVTLTASTPRLVIKSILDNDGRVKMSPCTLNPSVVELIRLIEDVSSLAGISAHNMWLFMTWRAEVLNSHLLAFVTDVRAKKGLVGGLEKEVGGLEKEVGGLEKEGAKAAAAMVNEVGGAVGVAAEVGVAIAQAEKMAPAKAGEPNMIPAEAGEPNMMMTTMYDVAAAAEESGNTDGEGGLSVAEGQTLKGSWREASGSLATPVSSLKSPLFGRGLNAA